jgi:hypothetical protein
MIPLLSSAGEPPAVKQAQRMAVAAQRPAPHQLNAQRLGLIPQGGTRMSMHDAEYVSQRRRAHEVPPRRLLSAAPSLPHGGGLEPLKSLPWPRNLFGEHATVAELLALRAEDRPNDLCACGCGREHQRRVPRILPNSDGNGFDFVHFWSVVCESKWTWTRERSQHDGRNQACSTSKEALCSLF